MSNPQTRISHSPFPQNNKCQGTENVVDWPFLRPSPEGADQSTESSYCVLRALQDQQSLL